MSWWKRWSAFRPARGVGHTYWLVRLAREAGGVVVCRDQTEADRIEKEHGAKAIGFREGLFKLRGLEGPIFVDVDAFVSAAIDVERESNELRAILAKIEPALRAFLDSVPPGADRGGVYMWCRDGRNRSGISAKDVEALLRAIR